MNVLKRPRLLRDGNEIGYLRRALKNTHANRYRAASRRPSTRQLLEDDAPPSHDEDITAREIMQAVASAPDKYRDAVIAVDLLGLSYREAARALHAPEATITTRLHRGRQAHRAPSDRLVWAWMSAIELIPPSDRCANEQARHLLSAPAPRRPRAGKRLTGRQSSLRHTGARA